MTQSAYSAFGSTDPVYDPGGERIRWFCPSLISGRNAIERALNRLAEVDERARPSYDPVADDSSSGTSSNSSSGGGGGGDDKEAASDHFFLSSLVVVLVVRASANLLATLYAASGFGRCLGKPPLAPNARADTFS